MATNADDDLAPSTTEGFKLSDKKTVDEYKKLGRETYGPDEVHGRAVVVVMVVVG